MATGIILYYKEDDEFIAVSSDTDLSQPVKTIHNGRDGDTRTVCLYLRNDDAAKWFSNIRVTPLDLVEEDGYYDVDYTDTGWGVKLSEGTEEPSSGEWDDIDWGDYIDMSDIGTVDAADTTTYHPFWYLISCPPNTDAKIKTDIVLNVSRTENAVVP